MDEQRLQRIEEKLDTVLKDHTEKIAKVETVQKGFTAAITLIVPALLGLASQVLGVK